MRCATRDVTGEGEGEGRGWQRQWAGQGEALRFPRLRPDQDICEGRGWGEGRVILKVRPRVPEKGFRNSPLDAYTGQGPPTVCPSVPGTIAQARRGLLRLKSGQLPDNASGVVAPPSIDFTPQHKQTGLRGGVYVCVPAAFGGHSLLQDSSVSCSSRGARGTLTRVNTNNGDVPKQRDAPAGPDGARPRGCHNIHASLIVRPRAKMRIPEQSLGPNPITSFAEDLAPGL